jgi:hypothetical protein
MTRMPKYVTLAMLGLAASVAVPSFVQAADKNASKSSKSSSSASASAAADTDYSYVQQNQLPGAVKTTAANETKGAKDIIYQKQSTGGKTAYSVHYTDASGKRMAVHIDESGKVIKGPFAYDDSKDRAEAGAQAAAAKTGGAAGGAAAGAGAGAGLSESNVQYRRVGDKDVPAAVASSLGKYSKGGKDVVYYSQVRGGQQIYSAHWTAADGKRMFVRLDPAGKVVLGPGETTEEGGKAIGAANNQPWARTQLASANDLPAEVRRGIEQATVGGTNHNFVKETRGSETRYYVEYDVNGRRTSAIFNPKGQLIEGEESAGTAAAAAPAAQPAETAAQPAAAQIGAQPAGAAPAAGPATGPWQLLSGADQLPAAVRNAANAQLTGSSDQIIQRFTQGSQTLYGIHFTPANGARQFMAVDSNGQVVVQPRKSNWQNGGQKVQFQAIGADQLSPQARQTVEGLKGTDHLFVQRTGENGKKEFLVQYNAAGGERMEVKLGEDGKLDEKPSKAKDDPFNAPAGKQKK